MTIIRQYSLPNCKLILHGLSSPTDNTSETRPRLSLLMNAECHFVGYPQPIVGGKEFFECLLQQVNQYAQEFLSGVSHPPSANTAAEVPMVELRRLDSNLHRLIVRNTPVDGDSQMKTDPTSPVELDLTTVQLFDLVEAVDQFLADSGTLPELSLQLKAIPKRYTKPEQSVAQRAIPAAVGVSGLAIAAIALFALPVPELRRPLEPNPQESTETQPPSETEGPQSAEQSPPQGVNTDPDGENLTVGEPGATIPLQPNLVSPPSIDDPQEIERLQRELFVQINQAWVARINRTLVYRVTVASDGKIIDYEAVDDVTPEEEAPIPLSELRFQQVGPDPAEPQADMMVIFNHPGGPLEVRPWQD
ncbi:DUF4335 domain-containing protein [Arthrospira platensis]|uniref:DUF4335 domain-containing protein n=1 Tax=Limnospira platensis NIES-46 TaxID=1236695 RepID=A0A5M3T9T1_LIMPL|nr:DUF4335 domain-containing protein [Arthrospira platensis]AMW27796.1 hypothetical protein AP285_07195 [Arthrospira platensis YZ]MBD2668734.1 DUF4335 domain-containing protein [Arthrospira platensis FACHB-439]MBD2709881.1 DUF4335 domain-containing protein [Arthrospira platensis FACHB-835]MDF2210696.1 DUF4335 domain-containing protein [Arthrospira platensis NCB002]MDT9182177.1 DUF4335 domain-containing protein [Limnospira sp. PMC 289.06]QQW30559.1 DUF4335 domain-containing protein [Arthrospir